MKRRSRPAVKIIGLILLALSSTSGCGNTADSDVAYTTIASTLRTFLDLWITEAVNAIADHRDENNNQNSNTSGNQNDNQGNGNGNTSGNDNGGPPIGDRTNGMTLFNMNCAGCHCPDASGGCAAGAPNIVGADFATIDDFVRRDADHPVKRDWTDQEVADVEAYLATIGQLIGDPTNGMMLYSQNCAGCHCADASGGCGAGAPEIVGAPFDAIDANVRGDDPHPVKRDWTDQEVTDVEAYLATLGQLVGDVVNGMMLYGTNCSGCHCADAVGGCAAGAPNIVEAPFDAIDANIRGDDPHPVKRDWTDQEVTDVEAYLATLGGPVTDIEHGMTLFSTNCSGCHCADASGGCAAGAPDIVGAAFEAIDANVRGDDPHPVKRDWTDQDVIDVEAYLGTLGASGQ